MIKGRKRVAYYYFRVEHPSLTPTVLGFRWPRLVGRLLPCSVPYCFIVRNPYFNYACRRAHPLDSEMGLAASRRLSLPPESRASFCLFEGGSTWRSAATSSQ